MAKKTEEIELENEVVEAPAPRIAHDFLRADLNELRDAVNELFAERG